jgi:pimeloyl-ACP methyl ester carboxylesterase
VPRWQVILALAGVCLLAIGAAIIEGSAVPRQDGLIVAGKCYTPATILSPPGGVNAIGTMILLHGLGANRRTMMYLGLDFAGHGFRTYLLDLPGHGDNKGAFTFARAEECANATVELLTREGQIDPRNTIVAGHSMGGAIAVRMADRNPLAATIGISPAPMVLPRRMPGNLLVLNGGYDLWPMKEQARQLSAAAGGERIQPVDFAEMRAFAVAVVPHATHTSLIVNREVAQNTTLWAMETLFPEKPAKSGALGTDLGQRALLGSWLGLAGLALLFPAGVVAAGTFVNSAQTESVQDRPPYPLLIAEQAVFALIGILVLAEFVPLRFLHLYDGEYLASLLLISGALLLISNWRYARANLFVQRKAVLAATVLGFAAILAAGGWSNWRLGDLWMNAPRWARFAALLPVGYLFCFAEEVTLGPVGAGKNRAMRFGVFLIMRLELWLAILLAYYELESGRALLGVLVTGMTIFSLVQRLATDALRLRTGSATAAAGFGAILAAWFIAAVFPLI